MGGSRRRRALQIGILTSVVVGISVLSGRGERKTHVAMRHRTALSAAPTRDELPRDQRDSGGDSSVVTGDGSTQDDLGRVVAQLSECKPLSPELVSTGELIAADLHLTECAAFRLIRLASSAGNEQALVNTLLFLKLHAPNHIVRTAAVEVARGASVSMAARRVAIQALIMRLESANARTRSSAPLRWVPEESLSPECRTFVLELLRDKNTPLELLPMIAKGLPAVAAADGDRSQVARYFEDIGSDPERGARIIGGLAGLPVESRISLLRNVPGVLSRLADTSDKVRGYAITYLSSFTSSCLLSKDEEVAIRGVLCTHLDYALRTSRFENSPCVHPELMQVWHNGHRESVFGQVGKEPGVESPSVLTPLSVLLDFVEHRSADDAALAVLRRAAESPALDVRFHLATELGNSASPWAVELLREIYECSSDSGAITMAVRMSARNLVERGVVGARGLATNIGDAPDK